MYSYLVTYTNNSVAESSQKPQADSSPPMQRKYNSSSQISCPSKLQKILLQCVARHQPTHLCRLQLTPIHALIPVDLTDLIYPQTDTMKLNQLQSYRRSPTLASSHFTCSLFCSFEFWSNHSRSNSEISQIHLNNLNSDLAPNIEH
ncbi:Hypothetical_protein [Hexamita inflata]|uniref:Hypothetical_protein n=1 Tax=Hexamita inflata TaxID=28002 RepID=A0AA86NQ51_9EUKA|nr:Hypothetical protein HINF_LOCUS11194 [Hexamita inflata]